LSRNRLNKDPKPLMKRSTLMILRYSLLLSILLGVAWLRFHTLAAPVALHPDEALFSTFARDAAVKGEWMLAGPLDKPPLSLYANALAHVFVGESPFAARLPGALSSILLVAVMVGLARGLYPKQVGLGIWVAALCLLSPYLAAFGATALTDSLMLLFMVMALWAASRGHGFGAGMALALAFASKQQGILYLPLVLVLFCARGTLTLGRFLRFALGLALGIGALLLWDAARPETSLFTLASANNPTRLIRSSEITPRLQVWLGYAGFLLGPPALTFGLSMGSFGLLLGRIWHRPYQRETLIDLILWVYMLLYGLAHWLMAWNLYDRYLLPVLPLLVLVTARLLNQAFTHWRKAPRLTVAVLTVFVGVGLVYSLAASEHRLPLHREQLRYQGIESVAAFLNERPVATVVYDHWLNWELGYYLGAWNDKRRVYYPTPQALVADALRLCEDGTRYFPVPNDRHVLPWLLALDQAGFDPHPVHQTRNFTVYALIPPWAGVNPTTLSCDASG
jgi:4-amino-4-deoxy-L-arabinose transferase-like glycosyltransferase